MEIINELSILLADELNELKRLNNIFMELDSHITEESKYVDRLDKVARIDALKGRLVSEVDRIQQEETSSESIFNTG